MARFYPLRVAGVKRETRDSVILTLEPAETHRDKFKFVQGQYLTFRRVIEGEELRRSYSICAGVNDGILRVGIKRVDGGAFSTFANEEVKTGDLLDAMAPTGNFHSPLNPALARRYLGFAGGSGITPMISIVKTVLEAEPQSAFTLVYGNRAAGAVMFREELEDLKNSHLGRLRVVHILETDSADIDLFTGRLDHAKCEALFGAWLDVKSADLAFICGPPPMMTAVSETLQAHGMDAAAIKTELFASAQPGRAARKAAAANAQNPDRSIATIVIDGVARDIEIAQNRQSVLEAALQANIDAPYACRAGVCSTCRAKLLEGEIEMDQNYALDDDDVARGYILTCQSHPRSKRIVVDYDQ